MARVSQSQTGAFFGVVAGALILALTAMALTGGVAPPPASTVAVQTADGGPPAPSTGSSG